MKISKTELREIRENLAKDAAERIIRQIDSLEEGSGLRVRKSHGNSDETDSSVYTDISKEEFEKNFSIARYLKGALTAEWDKADFEKGLFVHFHKALGEVVGTTGGFLVPPQYSQTLIPLLRAKSIVRQLGAMVYPMSGDTLKLPRQTGAAGTSWGDENTSMSEDTNPTFGNLVLVLKKLKSLLYVANELIEDASPSVDALITNDLVISIALAEDLAFLKGTGGDQPIGLYNHPNVQTTTLGSGSGAVPTLDDFMDAMQAIDDENGMYNGWAMNPRSLNTIRKIKDSTGNYIYWRDTQGRLPDQLFGYPVMTSTQIVSNLTVGSYSTASYIILANWNEVAIGQKGELRLETSRTGGNAWTYDQTSFRAIRRVDMVVRQPNEVYVIKGVLSSI